MSNDSRRFLLLLVRPDIAFALIWALVFALYSLRLVDFYPEPQWQVLAMVAGSLAIGLASSVVWSRLAGRTELFSAAKDALPAGDIGWSVIRPLLAVWIAGFLVIIAFSGGMPLYWYLAAVPRTYLDYGQPTFTGPWNTLPVVNGILAAFYLVRKPRFDYGLALVLAFLTLTVVMEVNRGGFVLYALNLLAAGVLVASTLKRQVLWAVVALTITLACVTVMGEVRSADPKAAAAVKSSFVPSDGSKPQGVRASVSRSRAISWAYLYMTSPIANLHNAATLDIPPAPFPGFYSLYPLLPSVVRPVLPDELRYPLPLLQKSYTMTTAYGPAVADFGFLGASIAMGLQLALGTLVFMLARKHLWALILAPMFFATTVLGFFTNYFFTLLMPFHAVLGIAVMLLLPRLTRGRATALAG